MLLKRCHYTHADTHTDRHFDFLGPTVLRTGGSKNSSETNLLRTSYDCITAASKFKKNFMQIKTTPNWKGWPLQKKFSQISPRVEKMWQGATTCCPYALPPTTQVTGQVTDYQHQIKDPVSCETENCVYYWKCKKDNCKNYPKCEYIGLTTRSYKQRIAEHKQ